MKHLSRIAMVVGLLGAAGALLSSSAAFAQNPAISTDVYAVKFLCGTFFPSTAFPEGPVKPGNYQTAINLHNPNLSSVVFQKKAVLLFSAQPPLPPPGAFERPMPPGQIFTAELPPDFGLEIDCADISKVLLTNPTTPPPNGFIKGFVVIEVPGTPGRPPAALDVVAVYTAHGFTSTTGTLQPEGFALELDRVKPTRR